MIDIGLEIYTEKSKRKLATRRNTYFVALIGITQSYSGMSTDKATFVLVHVWVYICVRLIFFQSF